MAKPKIYIDGKEGTTGLQIYDRLAGREDIELLLIDEEKRKDSEERRKLIHAADIVFLCLPDMAAIDAVALAEGSKARIIDAYRTPDGSRMDVWYGRAFECTSRGNSEIEPRSESRLSCDRIYHFNVSAGCTGRDSEGLSDDGIFADWLFGRRQKDDCRV